MASVVSDFWKSFESGALGSEHADNGEKEEKTHRFPIFTHLRLLPALDPTGISLDFTSYIRIVREGETRAQLRSVPAVDKSRSRPTQLRRPINILIVTRGQPHKSPNIIRESSPDEALAEVERNGRYNLGPRAVRINDHRDTTNLTSSMNELS